MSEDINIDEVVTRRFELDEQIAALAAKHKAELAPLQEEQGLCESFIKTELLKSGAQQWKSATTGHQTFWTTKDSVTVKDMDAVIRFMLDSAPPACGLSPAAWLTVLDHIQQHGRWELLNKAVNKTHTKELIEAATPPPGIEYTTFKDLAWRRGRAAT